MLSRFRVDDAKPKSTPLANHLKLSMEQSPKTAMEHDHIVKVSYFFVVESLIYVVVCTRSDIAHAVGAVSRYMLDPGKEH